VDVFSGGIIVTIKLICGILSIRCSRGCTSIKKRNKSEYLYLASRRDGKLKFDYVDSVGSENAREIMEKVKLRKDYELKLKHVKDDLRCIEKMIQVD
jgi:hypothetical protein